MKYNYQRLESGLRELLEAMSSFSSSEIGEVEEYLKVGEYGLAFETFCEIITNEGKPVPNELRPKIRALAEQMNIDPIWWVEIAKEELG
jgi:hypothetical protein